VGDQLIDRRLARLDLAESRQYRADVAQERVVRADHEEPLPGQLVAVGVEQVGRAVQADGGLAGAGSALHADGVADVGADDDVLLGLDGGDDVAHRPDPGTLDLVSQNGGGERRRVLVRAGRRRDVEAFVLIGREPAVRVPEPSAGCDALRVARAGPVERDGDRSAPVDHQRVAVVVGDVAATDVEALVAVLACGLVVQPAEEQRGGR